MQVTNTRNQPQLLASTAGVAVTIQPGETLELHGELLRIALDRGCVPTSETSAAPSTEAEPEPEPEATTEVVSTEQIQAAIQTLIDRGDQSAFTSQGKPRVRDVVVVLGTEVTREQVEVAFEAMPRGTA